MTAIYERPVTTRDIARAAGVNAATVSRALRGVSGVSPAVRKRIRALARKLDYHPNPYVSAFTAQVRVYRRMPRPATIAMLDCWPPVRPAWANFNQNIDYVTGIRNRARTLGYQIEPVRLADLNGSLERLQQLLFTRDINGLLVLPTPAGVNLSGLNFSRLACAAIDFTMKNPATMRRTGSNYYHNVWLALTTLAERGYRRIGYVRTIASLQGQDNNPMLAAFFAYRAMHPLVCVTPLFCDVKSRLAKLDAWMRRLRPDVVITSDFLLPDDLKTAGWRVPDEVACMSLSRPPSGRNVTHIDERNCLVGAQAVDMIVDAIHRNEFGLPSTRIVHLIDGVWREGATVRRRRPGNAGRSPVQTGRASRDFFR